MAPADTVRPGSALAADPGLAATLAAAIPPLQAAAASGGRDAKRALANAVDTYSLLAALPWQRMTYRIGHWASEANTWKALLTFDAWESYRWQRNEERFQVLDPHGGQRLGELYTQAELRRLNGGPYAAPEVLGPPGGTLEFAGDPATIGVYRPPGGAAGAIRLTWNPYLNHEVLRDGIKALREGAADRLPPPYQFVDWDLLDKYRVWFTESRDKPAGKAPWAAEARLYRPGGPPQFGKSR
ncbi:hypothetical protein ACFQS1_02330 [Paractinoplanes rhizophilus]|jgi:hypothetical protein|uniref:Uncharacterized protein n=1 Tax=Paractinoplanes rhizophilus TaxID=1416877 RepID=A0ABW2HJW8_9ACTN|nr:hypothetical protein [Actinoplanes sp.]